MTFFPEDKKTLFANLLNVGMVIGLIVFIAFLFPYQSGTNYEYEINKPWPYDNLVSPTSFGVVKSEEQLELEREKTKNSFLPYFEKDTAQFHSSLEKFDQLLDQLAEGMKDTSGVSDLIKRKELYLNLARQQYLQIYRAGLIDTTTLDENYRPIQKFQLVEGDKRKIADISRVLTQSEARAYVQEQLRASEMPDADLILSPLIQSLKPNIHFTPERTERYLQMALEDISETEGVVKEGELIVESGEIITPKIHRKIDSYQSQYRPTLGSRLGSWWVFVGYLSLTVYLIFLFLLFLKSNAREVYFHFNQLLFMILWIALYSYLVSVIDPIENISTYIIPFCVVPIVVKNFFNDRLALFLHLIIILLASYLTSLGYEFMFIEIVAGIATVLSFRVQAVWNRLFTTVGIIFLSYAVSYMGLSLIREGNIYTVNYSYFLWFFLSAFLTFLAYPLLPLLERVFRFTSDITLGELSDMNHPLLKKLSVEAPGTLQHSLQVSNLAEAAAVEIGADALSVKVAALYHDVGKTKRPEFFIENQSGYNPHDKLSPKESAEIIIEHVTHGLELAKKHGLPKLIRNFIASHHGTTRVEYFYRQHLANNKDTEIDEGAFVYPGPKPKSKEEAIFMLADSLEASCKSLDQPSYEDLIEMIDRIITFKVSSGQLEESHLSFKELEMCKIVFRKMLKSIHHVRVSYDDGKNKEEE